jgi:hypothetical protein
MQGKDIYVRNYYSTKAFFDVMPGQRSVHAVTAAVGRCRRAHVSGALGGSGRPPACACPWCVVCLITLLC